MSFVLNKFSQIVNIDPKLTTYWHKRGEQFRNELCIYDKSRRETPVLFREWRRYQESLYSYLLAWLLFHIVWNTIWKLEAPSEKRYTGFWMNKLINTHLYSILSLPCFSVQIKHKNCKNTNFVQEQHGYHHWKVHIESFRLSGHTFRFRCTVQELEVFLF